MNFVCYIFCLKGLIFFDLNFNLTLISLLYYTVEATLGSG